MLQTSRILPGVVHEVAFSWPGSSLQLMDATAEKILFFASIKEESGPLILNDRVGDEWGTEVSIPRNTSESSKSKVLYFKFNGSNLEVWNDRVAQNFHRFDVVKCSEVALVGLYGVENVSKSLDFRVITPEVMGEMIANRVLLRRIEVLEKKMF